MFCVRSKRGKKRSSLAVPTETTALRSDYITLIRCPAKQVLDSISEAVDEFVGDNEQFDDLTMLCVEYKG